MKLTLIRGSELAANSANMVTTPPVGIAYLAGYLRAQGHEPKVIDGLGEAIFAFQPIFAEERKLWLHGLSVEEIVARIDSDYADCIGVSCMFSQDWPFDKMLLAAIRARFPRARIVCGGEHISALPEFSLTDCPAIDFCVQGEGERALALLLEALAATTDLPATELEQRCAAVPGLYYRASGGTILRGAANERLREIDALPWPAWDLVPLENYLATGSGFGVNKGRNMPIVASRGCPYACTFCSNLQMWTTKWVARDPVQVVDEIEYYHRQYAANNFDFYDLTAIVRKDWILRFCAELESRNLRITYQLPSGTRSEAIDAEVAAALRRTGCCHLVYAPESGSARTLKLVNKRVNLANLTQSMRQAVGEGITVKMNIVIGFPDENWRDILRTFRFLARTALLGVHDAFVYTFSPYPGSELFARLRKEGRLARLDEDYFLDLTSYIRLGKSVSYCTAISNFWLNACRLGGLFLFYSVSFLARPQRFIRILSRLNEAESETRIEIFVKSILRRTVTAGLVAGRKRLAR